MGNKHQIAPDGFDLFGLTPDQARHKGFAQEADDGGATSADGVTIAHASRSIRIGDGDDGGFLTDKGLDRIRPFDRGNKIEHADFNVGDLGHLRRLN